MGESEVAVLNERVENVRGMLEAHVKECSDDKFAMTERLATIERLCYIGVGGIIVIGGMIGLFGTQIVKMDVTDRYKRADAVADKQDASQREHEMRQRLERLERK